MSRKINITIDGSIFSSKETAEWLIQQIEDSVRDRTVVIAPTFCTRMRRWLKGLFRK